MMFFSVNLLFAVERSENLRLCRNGDFLFGFSPIFSKRDILDEHRVKFFDAILNDAPYKGSFFVPRSHGN